MGDMVTFAANGRQADGYLAIPKPGKGPGLVVVQEYWGLVPHIRAVVDRAAGEGFVALAPDLYHGETTTSADQAWKMLLAMRVDEAEKDLRGAIRFLEAHPAVSPKKIGTIGFCMGGALSLYAASKNPNVAACVVFYGVHPSIKPDLANLKAPVLGIYGAKDDFVNAEVVKALDEELTRLGKRHEFHTYPAGHAFFNDTGKNYNAAAAADAWQRAMTFLKRELS